MTCPTCNGSKWVPWAGDWLGRHRPCPACRTWQAVLADLRGNMAPASEPLTPEKRGS